MAKNETAEMVETAGKRENLFSKDQLLNSERFRGRRDILNVLLRDDKEYSVESAELMIEKYLKGKVN